MKTPAQEAIQNLVAQIQRDGHGRTVRIEGGFRFESGAVLTFPDGGGYLLTGTSASSEDRQQAKRQFLEMRAYEASYRYERLKEELRNIAEQCRRDGSELPPDFEDQKARLPELKRLADEATKEFWDDVEPERQRAAKVEQSLRAITARNSRQAAEALESLESL